MKNLKLILSSAVVVALLASCSKSPKACFTVSVYKSAGKFETVSKGSVGESFFFSPLCSKKIFSGATVFDYGDGSTGSQEEHVYKKPGTYTVKCTVYSASAKAKGDQSDVASQTVTVTQPLQAQAETADAPTTRQN